MSVEELVAQVSELPPLPPQVMAQVAHLLATSRKEAA
jgi:hypothetical protein